MEDQVQDVKQDEVVDPSTATGLPEPAGKTTDSPDIPASEETSSAQDVKPVDDVDEKGVPWKNRAMEYQRKYQDLSRTLEERVPEMIEQAVTRTNQSTQGKVEYSKEDLIRFKNQTDNPDHRAWAESELEKVRERDLKNMLESERKREREQQFFEQQRQSAVVETMRMFPQAFDKSGNWNTSDPLTQRISQIYNSDPVFKQQGMGLLAAAKIAYSELAVEKQQESAKTTQTLKRQVKKLEKATQVEGGGVSSPPQSKTQLQKLYDQFQKSGREEDLKAYMRAKINLG